MISIDPHAVGKFRILKAISHYKQLVTTGSVAKDLPWVSL